jgi:cysteine desulfurase
MDNHATTRVDPRVLQAMLPWFSERYGNAASISHGFGHEAADAVRAAREAIAAVLHCPAESLIFTSGATESNNLALKGVLQAVGPESHLIVNAVEHRAVLDPAKRLRRTGHPVTIIPVDVHGRIDPQGVAEALQPSTRLVSVMLANNEVGTLNPVAEIGALCRERGVVFHCDASQAVGRVAVDLAQLPIDLMSFTAHKLYGPKGVGALYVRRGAPRIPLTPQIDGGGHEGGLRSGTLPVPLIVGFAEALRLAAAELEPESQRLLGLREQLQGALCDQIDGVVIHGHPTERLSGNLNAGFEGVDGEALMVGVAQRGLAVSSGSACTSANPEPSHVLRGMGVPEGLARASLRFGLGRFNTAEEVDVAVAVLIKTVAQLRGRR